MERYVELAIIAATDLRDQEGLEGLNDETVFFWDHMVRGSKNLYHDGRGRVIVYSNRLNTPVVMPGLLVVCCEEFATSLMEYRRRSTFNSEGAIEGDWQNQTKEVHELLKRANCPGIMEIIFSR